MVYCKLIKGKRKSGKKAKRKHPKKGKKGKKGGIRKCVMRSKTLKAAKKCARKK